MHALAAHLHLVLQVGETVGEISGQNLAAALEHGNALSGARQTRGGNAAAIARSDDDHVVAILEAIERARQSGHAFMFPEVAESSSCAKAQVASNAARCISRARRFHGNGAPHTANTTAPPVRPAPAAHMRILVPFGRRPALAAIDSESGIVAAELLPNSATVETVFASGTPS